jgi:sulfatase maturation enzyme AslB (radical SAM superfamily)
MDCPRLDHFVRFNPNGTVSRCGHMINPAQFDSLESLENSKWLRVIKDQFENNQWPHECSRCQQVEVHSPSSIRIHAIALDELETQRDYLQVGGVLDNVCNAACQTCSPDCSTRIGALIGKTFPIVNNSNRFWELPQDRIRHLDINGGEPSYSKNYKRLLKNLPPNLKTLRLNTNCNVVLHELIDIVAQGVEVTVTVSCDGIGEVHEFMRWPIKWDTFYQNLMTYKAMPVKLNLWTTVSILNINDLPTIQTFAKEHNIDHGYAYLKEPAVLDVNNTDRASIDAYIQKQKQLRGIQ